MKGFAVGSKGKREGCRFGAAVSDQKAAILLVGQDLLCVSSTRMEKMNNFN